MKDEMYVLNDSLNSKWHEDLMTFGVQSMGLRVRIFLMNASFDEVADFHRHSFQFPQQISEALTIRPGASKTPSARQEDASISFTEGGEKDHQTTLRCSFGLAQDWDRPS
jgi:hypothetical protein